MNTKFQILLISWLLFGSILFAFNGLKFVVTNGPYCSVVVGSETINNDPRETIPSSYQIGNKTYNSNIRNPNYFPYPTTTRDVSKSKTCTKFYWYPLAQNDIRNTYNKNNKWTNNIYIFIGLYIVPSVVGFYLILQKKK